MGDLFDMSDGEDMFDPSRRGRGKTLNSAIMAKGAALENEKNKNSTVKSALGNSGRRKRMNVYTFGEAKNSKLGHEKRSKIQVPTLVGALLDKDVIDIVFGERHALALTADGNVYSWGFGGDGQLGHGDRSTQPVPRLMTALSKEHVVKVVAGNNHSACLNQQGQVFTWGASSAGQLGHGDTAMGVRPKQVTAFLGKRIVDIAAGDLHTLFVTDEGAVYACGSGLGYRLGVNDEDQRNVPTEVTHLTGKGIRQVRCHGAMSVAMTALPPEFPLSDEVHVDTESAAANVNSKIKSLESSLAKAQHEATQAIEELNLLRADKKTWEQEVRAWERDKKTMMAENLKLGFEKGQMMDQMRTAIEKRDLMRKELEGFLSLPSHFQELNTKGVKQVASGRSHVLALLDNFEVKCFGENKRGQLGLGFKKSPKEVRTIGKLRNKAIKMIACGDEHSVALTYAGDVYCWGSSQNGQCGVGKRAAILEPTKVLFSGAEKPSIRVIGAGARHTVALTGDGRVFVWGRVEIGGVKHGSSGDKPLPTLVGALTRDLLKDRKELMSDNQNTNEILTLIHEHGMDAKQVQDMLPNISEDPVSQLLLTKELNTKLEKDVKNLQQTLEDQRKAFAQSEKEFRNNQTALLQRANEADMKQKQKDIDDNEKLLAQRQELSKGLSETIDQLEKDIKIGRENMDRVKREKDSAMAQAKTDEKASILKSRDDVLHDMEVTQAANESKLTKARIEREQALSEITSIQAKLEELRVELRQFEQYGLRNQLEMTRKAIHKIITYHDQLQATAIEQLNAAKKEQANLQALRRQALEGLTTMRDESNRRIDGIVGQLKAADIDKTAIDPQVFNWLQRLIVDNAELRKRINDYTWGLMQYTHQRDETLRSTVSTKAFDMDINLAGNFTRVGEVTSSSGLFSSISSLFKKDSGKQSVDSDRQRRDLRTSSLT